MDKIDEIDQIDAQLTNQINEIDQFYGIVKIDIIDEIDEIDEIDKIDLIREIDKIKPSMTKLTKIQLQKIDKIDYCKELTKLDYKKLFNIVKWTKGDINVRERGQTHSTKNENDLVKKDGFERFSLLIFKREINNQGSTFLGLVVLHFTQSGI